jgi:NTP pyrophosphatase (non-canonical NTP hydrolase)
MELNEYQKKARETAMYPRMGNNYIYPTLGLAGEAGEVVEKIKKLMRNDGVETPDELSVEKRDEIIKEMGDVLWYLSQLASEIGVPFDTVAERNIEKLASRMERGVLNSEGDNR